MNGILGKREIEGTRVIAVCIPHSFLPVLFYDQNFCLPKLELESQLYLATISQNLELFPYTFDSQSRHVTIQLI